MEYVQLGKSGLVISRIVLGCMSYGSKEWEPWVEDEEASIPLIKAAYDAVCVQYCYNDLTEI